MTSGRVMRCPEPCPHTLQKGNPGDGGMGAPGTGAGVVPPPRGVGGVVVGRGVGTGVTTMAGGRVVGDMDGAAWQPQGSNSGRTKGQNWGSTNPKSPARWKLMQLTGSSSGMLSRMTSGNEMRSSLPQMLQGGNPGLGGIGAFG